MGTFIRFTDKQLIHSNQVTKLTKKDRPSIDKDRANRHSVWDYDSYGVSTDIRQWNALYGENNQAAITVTLVEKEIILRFATVEERDTEFDRFEGLLNPVLTVVFPSLSIDLSTVRAVNFSWPNPRMSDNTLHVQLMTGATEPLLVVVKEKNEEGMKYAHELARRFGLSIPESPTEAWHRMFDEDRA